MQKQAASQCEGSGQPVGMVTQIGGEYVGRCSACAHPVVCSSTAVARVHDRSDVLTLF